MDIRDPVHNFIYLNEIERKLVAAGVFQRLRDIRQLAFGNLVYPGALHTRFDHSLGVCHVAGLLARRLDLQDHETRLVRLAALLHDLGHGPFSHVSEHALERFADREKLAPDQKKEKIHELITARLIQTDEEIGRLLSDSERTDIVKLLKDGHGRPALRAIVSGPLDADKQDYLLRDSFFCGVAYGKFDVHQLHRSLILEGPKDEEELMIDPDGLHAVEQYVLAKYYLTTNVYRHRVRLITDCMIVRAIQLGIEKDEDSDLADLYSFDGSDSFVDAYRKWDDAHFMERFACSAQSESLCGQMLQRLKDRRLLKRVFTLPLKEVRKPEARALLPKIGRPEFDAVRENLERSVAKVLTKQTGLKIKPEFVIAHTYTIKSVREASRNDEGSIMVACTPTPQPFEEKSALFASINEGYKEGYVEVYAPLDWSTETDKKKTRRTAEPIIRAFVEAVEEVTSEGAQ